MRVADWMSSPVHVVKPLDSAAHAREVLEKHRINQLPVVVDGKVVGIVTDRDLRDAFPSVIELARPRHRRAADAPENITVEQVMTPGVRTIAPHDTVEEAIQVMRKERFGALPVLEQGRLVGILARSDVLGAALALAATVKQLRGEVAPRNASDEIRRNW